MTLLAVLTTAVTLTGCSVAVGAGVRRLAGLDGWSWSSAGLGLGALVVIAALGVSLPGAGTTAAVLVGVTVIACLPQLRHAPREGVLVAALCLAAAWLPFIAAGRIGLLGAGDNGDLAGHLVLADAIGHGHEPSGLDPTWWPGYPTGPHSLAAAFATATGIDLDAVFTGLLLAIAMVTGLTGLAALRSPSLPRRVAGALLAAIPYLSATYLIQSSFKEPLAGAFLIAAALLLPEIADAARTRIRALLPFALLTGASFATFSTVGLIWPLLTAAIWLAFRNGLSVPRPSRQAIRAGLAFAAVLAIAILPQTGRAKAFFGGVKAAAAGETTGGNVRTEVPGYEVFGVWPNRDFRGLGEHPTEARILALLAGVVALWALWQCWRRGRLELLAIVGATALVYVPARLFGTPYYSAKALTLAAIALMLATLAGLLDRESRLPGHVVAFAFIAAALWSSGLALRNARVLPGDHGRELSSLRPLLHGQPTLYMGQNDYIAWTLRGVPVSFPYAFLGRSQVDYDLRPAKDWAINRVFDFDSITPQTLDRFRFAIASRSAFASAAPPNWRRVRSTRSFDLWERRGPAAPRETLAEGDAPGRVLNCSSPEGAAIGETAASVAVRGIPLVKKPTGLPGTVYGMVATDTSGHGTVRVRAPGGLYDLSAQFQSPEPVEAVIGGRVAGTAPASLEGLGMMWRLGTIDLPEGGAAITLRTQHAPPLAKFRQVLFGRVALTPLEDGVRVVPAKSACSRYVDWYRPG